MSSNPSIPSPHIEAEVTALATEDGGRKSPMLSGYRPNHDFGLEGMLNDATHQYEKGQLAPGETGKALLTLHVPEYQRGRLHEGMEFTVQEGSRIVGRGKIVKVLDESLRVAHNSRVQPPAFGGG